MRRLVVWGALIAAAVAGLSSIFESHNRGGAPLMFWLSAAIAVCCVTAGVVYEAAEHVNARRKTTSAALFAQSRIEAERFTELAATQNDVALHQLGMEALMVLVADRVLRLVGADDARVIMFEGGRFVIRAGVGRSATAVGRYLNFGRNLTTFAYTTASAVLSNDAQADEREDRQEALRTGTRSVVAVPLYGQGAALGVFSVSSASPNRFDELDAATVKVFAGQLTAALALADEASRAADSRDLRIDTLDAIEAGVVYYNARGAILDANASASRILQSRLDAITEMESDKTVVHYDEQGQVTNFFSAYLKPVIAGRLPQIGRVLGVQIDGGDTTWLSMNLRPLRQPPYAAVCSFTDVTSFKRDVEEQRFLAEHDRLTGLPNRVWLLAEMKFAVADRMPFALAFIDLNGFKAVNDSYGHSVGDEALVATAKRISEALPKRDTLARLGGDEFAVFMPNPQRNEAGLTSDAITRCFVPPMLVGDVVIRMSASVGIAYYPDDGATVEELMRLSDQRMYEAKGYMSGDPRARGRGRTGT